MPAFLSILEALALLKQELDSGNGNIQGLITRIEHDLGLLSANLPQKSIEGSTAVEPPQPETEKISDIET